MLPGLASHTRDACQHSGPAQTRETQTCIAPQLGVIEENVSDALVCLPPSFKTNGFLLGSTLSPIYLDICQLIFSSPVLPS